MSVNDLFDNRIFVAVLVIASVTAIISFIIVLVDAYAVEANITIIVAEASGLPLWVIFLMILAPFLVLSIIILLHATGVLGDDSDGGKVQGAMKCEIINGKKVCYNPNISES